MLSETHRSSCTNVRHGRWKPVSVVTVLLILAAGALPCGRSQQNQPRQSPAAPASAAPDVPKEPAGEPQQAAPAAGSAGAGGGAQTQHPAAESAALLKLATELKAAVDKSSKDTLSLAVIRKAEEIERMAHGMKDKYKANVAAD